MIIDQKLLDDLSAQAKANPRLRQSYDLRTTPDDNSQRMLNALEPGTELPIHRHRHSSETMVVIRGSVTELFYNDEGTLTDAITVAPIHNPSNLSNPQSVPMIQIEKGQWHSLKCNEPDTIIFEAKDRAYEPLTEEDILTFTK